MDWMLIWTALGVLAVVVAAICAGVYRLGISRGTIHEQAAFQQRMIDAQARQGKRIGDLESSLAAIDKQFTAKMEGCREWQKHYEERIAGINLMITDLLKEMRGLRDDLAGAVSDIRTLFDRMKGEAR